jgi:ACT domain-containing protein
MNKIIKVTTKQKKELFLEALEKNAGNITESCKKINISRKTFYHWCKKDEYFKNQVEEIKESLIDLAENELMEQIKKGNITAIIFFLKTKGKNRGYTEKQEIKHSENIDSQIKIYLPQKEDIN